MAEVPPPDREKTHDLADRVVQAHQDGEELTGFQNEINNLTNDERLQFVQSVNDIQGENPNRKLYADGVVDTTTGNVVDIDLMGIDRSDEKNPKVEDVDVYTSPEVGEAFDKQQAIERATTPYKNLVWMMNLLNGVEGVQDHVRQVGDMLKGNMLGNPDKDAMMTELTKGTLVHGDGRFKSVGHGYYLVHSGWDGAADNVIQKRETISKILDERRESQQAARGETQAVIPWGNSYYPSQQRLGSYYGDGGYRRYQQPQPGEQQEIRTEQK